MPINPNYQNSLIYKIVCNDTNIKEIYIGSTTNFRLRKSQHKCSCNNETHKYYNFYVYKFIRENGGFENWSMVLIDYVPCETKLELLKCEREHIEKIDKELLLNQQIPSRTIKEWKEDNKERTIKKDNEYRQRNKTRIKEKKHIYYQNNKEEILQKCEEYRKKNGTNLDYNKNYYNNNKETILEKQREKINCPICNSVVCKTVLKRHQRTKKCINLSQH